MSRSDDNTARALPDVAADAGRAAAGTLRWVGMRGIEVPVLVEGDEGLVRTPARVSAEVNLARPDARGIHMSRLYLQLDQLLSAEALTPCTLRRLLRGFLESHEGLSDRARLRIGFEYMLRRRALRSDNSGWRAYPVEVLATMEGGELCLELAVTVTYSSTCPCSAALARQLIQQRFANDFPAAAPIAREEALAWIGSEHGIHATPHSQRSTAEVRVRLATTFAGFPLVALIDAIEDALQTPVQTAVKRIDEQAFAERNGANLMFCEDAARRVQAVLDADPRIVDFQVRASHMESLHPHDAVAVATKGIEGGYSGD